MIDGRLIWIATPDYTVGLVVSAGVVVYAPPIAQWTVGRPEREVADYFRRKGADIAPIDPPSSGAP